MFFTKERETHYIAMTNLWEETSLNSEAGALSGFQGVDLTYLQTGTSGVFFWVLNFKNLNFLGTCHSCFIFGGR